MYGKTIATPPGATIREMLEDKRISNTVFAFRMGMSLAEAEALIQGKTSLTDRVAYRLELVLVRQQNSGRILRLYTERS